MQLTLNSVCYVLFEKKNVDLIFILLLMQSAKRENCSRKKKIDNKKKKHFDGNVKWAIVALASKVISLLSVERHQRG